MKFNPNIFRKKTLYTSPSSKEHNKNLLKSQKKKISITLLILAETLKFAERLLEISDQANTEPLYSDLDDESPWII